MLRCLKCQHLWKFPFTANPCQGPHLHILSILRKAVWGNVPGKREGYGTVRSRHESLGRNGWQRIHIKDRLLFSHHTKPSLQSNRPHWMNSITHTVISYCHCRVRGDGRMGIQFYRGAPSKSRRESEIVEKCSPQDVWQTFQVQSMLLTARPQLTHRLHLQLAIVFIWRRKSVPKNWPVQDQIS